MFLRDVSIDLLNRYGNNLRNITVVFPGKRAKLFMNQYLAQESDAPVWAPNYITIDELVQRSTPYSKADTITSICQLYKIYDQLVPDAESLDEFYGWGEVILSDFDDIDKHMAPATKIFQNARDINAISTDYLEDYQIEALSEFFKNFKKSSELKERFLRLWDIMPDLYTRLNEELRQQGRLYSGAQYRFLAEAIKEEKLEEIEECKLLLDESQVYAFVGFNILDESTEAIFKHFHKEKRALFYWDYDKLYVKDEKWEAGTFIRQDLRLLPNALGEEYFDNLSKPKDITFIATSTNNAQSRYIPEWIKQNLTATENETAIILADEHNLGSVLYTLPEEKPRNINITMGYPLSETQAYSFISILMSMYIDGYDPATQKYRHTAFERCRRHPYFAYCPEDTLIPQPCESTDLLERLIAVTDAICEHYASQKNNDIYNQLYTEALFQIHLILNRFLQLSQPNEAGESILSVNPFTLRRLLNQVLSTTSIPFHGEPIIGMQVMGLLETRNIDFRNILMLNVEEGTFPKKSDDVSFIPYNLREAFGLTTIRHKISVFAYYFYRLLSRAEHVTLMFNETSSGTTNSEMSRFMRQLMAETDLPIKYIRLIPNNSPKEKSLDITIQKTPQMRDLLMQKYVEGDSTKSLSPTAINTYLKCSLQFYYQYVAGIWEPDKPEDGITNALFGTIFHDSAELFYKHLIHHYGGNVTITADLLKNVLEYPDLHLYPFTYVSLILNYFIPLDRAGSKKSNSREYDKEKNQEIERISRLKYEEVRHYVKDYFDAPGHTGLLTGLTHIIDSVLKQYLLQLVKYDQLHAPFQIVGLEQDCSFRIEFEDGKFVRTGGRIDRLERDKDGVLTIVDYKTGGKSEVVRDMNAIFAQKTKGCSYFLQTFIYALAKQDELHNPDSPLPPEPVRPTLFFVNRSSNTEAFDRNMRMGTDKNNQTIDDISAISEEFTARLKETLQNIFSLDTPFQSAEDAEHTCKYCNFKQLCNRAHIKSK